MAEGDIHVYRSFKRDLLKGLFDLANDAIAVALVDSYTPDYVSHETWSQVSANEMSDGSYSRGALNNTAVTATGTGTGTALKGKWDADDITFASLTAGTAPEPNYLILFDDAVTSPADPLICAMELTTSTNGGDYVISWNANGIIRIG